MSSAFFSATALKLAEVHSSSTIPLFCISSPRILDVESSLRLIVFFSCAIVLSFCIISVFDNVTFGLLFGIPVIKLSLLRRLRLKRFDRKGTNVTQSTCLFVKKQFTVSVSNGCFSTITCLNIGNRLTPTF